jgi:hypothetical protein
MLNPIILPEPIAAYFDADKRNVEAIARCFTDDAEVKDEGQTHTGIRLEHAAGRQMAYYTSADNDGRSSSCHGDAAASVNQADGTTRREEAPHAGGHCRIACEDHRRNDGDERSQFGEAEPC